MIERRGAIAIWRDQEGQITVLRGSDDVKPHFMCRHTVPTFGWKMMGYDWTEKPRMDCGGLT